MMFFDKKDDRAIHDVPDYHVFSRIPGNDVVPHIDDQRTADIAHI